MSTKDLSTCLPKSYFGVKYRKRFGLYNKDRVAAKYSAIHRNLT
jgi:hypothetical protein